MNRLIQSGNLGKDVEITYTKKGTAIAKASIASNTYFKNAEGVRMQETMFIDTVAFGKTAEIMNQYCKKGTKVLLEGKLKLEQWTAQDGSKRSRHVMQIESIELIGAKPVDADTPPFDADAPKETTPVAPTNGRTPEQEAARNKAMGK